jgi:hypothetical protein
MIPLTGWSHWQHNALPFSPEYAARSYVQPGSCSESNHLVIPFNQPHALCTVVDELLRELLSEATAVTFLLLCHPENKLDGLYPILKGLHALGQSYTARVQVSVCAVDVVAAVEQINAHCPIDIILIDRAGLILNSTVEKVWQILIGMGFVVESLRCKQG